MKPYAEVIGNPIAQSKSPSIHGFWLHHLGIEGGYGRQLVEADGLAQYLDSRRRDPAWRGCNVTMPHKQAIIPLLDRIEDDAAAIGAVNTVVRDRDTLIGLNTDARGFLEPLRGVLEQTHYFRMARIIGTGGAARAIVVALAREGFTIVLAGRDPAKARALLDELTPRTSEHYAIDLAHFSEPTDFSFDDRVGCLDLIVNASPLGMRGQPPLAFDWSHAPPDAIAYDIVTDPAETAFLAGARRAGHSTIDGEEMLIGQAALAFERFYGQKPPRDRDAELRALLK